ncbi:hypothetical protein [Anaeroselena agilis]|uniref:DUF304 domain-containing protein n=1 Tax=Anaeroselena agilis TaxID=3063788 RepID=A0ABU3NVK3_9FIRM|nr:hypothetical protein [Selenomonadales bacterium 4137-cl]
MPKNWWTLLFYVISCVAFYGTQLIWNYDQVGPAAGLSKGEWLAWVLGIYVTISGLVYWLIWRAGKGTVTQAGLERENGPAIPLISIERIVSEGGGFPSVVFLAVDQVKVHIVDRELVKLAKTRLNQWTVNGKKLIVTPGEVGAELKISYALLGRYDTYRFASLSTLVMVVFVMAILFGLKLGWNTEWLLEGCLIYGFVFLIIPLYRRVRVSVLSDRVVLKRGKKEESFRFGDVAGIEKGLFQVKVTAKDGKVFFFPRGCILLPEIIEEFTGLAGRRRGRSE